jgi:hypothetical protein
LNNLQCKNVLLVNKITCTVIISNVKMYC